MQDDAVCQRSVSVTGPSRPAGTPAVAHSILAAEAIAAQVAECYAAETPLQCRLLLSGLNDTYLLTTVRQRRIVRVYSARSSLSGIRFELEVLAHLACKGISVSTPIARDDGGLTCSLPAPEGVRYAVIFTLAEGTAPSWSDERQCHRAGGQLAMIHTATTDFASQWSRPCLDLRHLLHSPLQAIEPLMAHRPVDWCYLQGLAARLDAQASKAAEAGLDWGVCHGDFCSRNIRIASDGSSTVFDLDHCGFGWRAYDLVEAQRVARFEKSPGIWESFLAGYVEKRPLASPDRHAVALFDAISHFAGMGHRAAMVDRWGLECVSDAHFDWELASLREWEAANEPWSDCPRQLDGLITCKMQRDHVVASERNV